MRSTLVDGALEQRLRQDGYVVVPLLDDTALADLRGFWAGLGTDLHAFHSTIHDPSPEHKLRVDEHLKAVTASALAGLFDRHRAVIANFVAKAPGADSEMPEHLDWTMVDEPNVVSVGVWAPLVDTDATNGGLCLIRRSHQTLRALRGTPHFPDFVDLQTVSHRFDPDDRIQLDLRAGQAVIYDHRMVHYSAPNGSDRERIAINVAVVPREARTYHHHLHPDGRVERFQVDDRFYVTHDITQVPQGTLSLGYVAREFASLLPEPEQPVLEERRATFSDPDLQRAFARDGYVKVPLVGPAEVRELNEVWDGLTTQRGPGFHASIYSDAREYRAGSDAAIKRILGPALDGWLDDHEPYIGNFVVKVPGEESEVGAHQDWTFADETKFSTVTIWCPLTDTDEANGTLRVVPGSHRWVQSPRGTPINAFPFAYQELRDTILAQDSVAISVKAGEAIIADHRLVHGSAPNRSDGVRVVAGCGARPAEADLLHYFLDDDGTAQVYRVDDAEFFSDLRPGERPEGLPLVATVPVEPVSVSAEEFDALLGRRLPRPPAGVEPEPASEAEVVLPVDEVPDAALPVAEPVVAPPAPSGPPRLRRRLWNVLTPEARHRIRALWRALPGPVRRAVDPRQG